MHADQNGMQGLISIGFRYCDIVFELPRHGFKNIVHNAESSVAIIGGIDYQSKSKHIHNIAKRFFLFAHFKVDAPQMFFAALHYGIKGFTL